MKYVKTIGLYGVYNLDEKECKEHLREFPCFVCWYSTHHEDIGNMSLTENESGTIEEMKEWCEEYSR